MDRRRFLIGTASAAGVGAALATDACSSVLNTPGGTVPPLPPPGGYQLPVQYAVTNIKGYKLRTRTYGGRTFGPMLTTRPGETLTVQIVNRLPHSPDVQLPRGSVPIPDVRTMAEAMMPMGRPTTASSDLDKMNNPHGFNDTNLHVHGIQTIPHLFDPVGTRNPHAMMLSFKPGQSFTYHFPIPQDHPSGLFWYHPHKHGSVDVQVSGGMAGLIVVRGPIDEVPEIAAAREIFLVFQTLNVNKSTAYPGLYDYEPKPYKSPLDGGYNLGTAYTMVTTNGVGVCWIDNNAKPNTYKALGVPKYFVKPGEVVRLRMLNGTNSLPFFLTLPGFETWDIGFDGINLLKPTPRDMSGSGVTTIDPANLFSAPVDIAGSGNRLELLIRAPKKSGTYTLSALGSNGVSFEAIETIALADFVVEGSQVSMGIPSSLPKPVREYPAIPDSEIVAHRKVKFSEHVDRSLLTGFGFFVDDKLYDEMDASLQPKVGTAEEWTVVNTSSEVHPFHIHENSFQLTALNKIQLTTPEFWDTFIVPPKGTMKFRIRFKQWYGKTVFHCHVLPHEDTGMMKNILMV